MSINLFDNTIKDPILYIVDEESPLGELYINTGKTGTRGIEAEIKYSNERFGYLFLNYAFYTASGKDIIPDFQVIEDKPIENVVLAFPNHKISASGHFAVWRNLSINPGFNLYSESYLVSALNEDEEPIYEREKSGLIFNANLLYENLFNEYLDVSIGFFDIFDAGYNIYQPYVGRPAMETNGRVVQFKINLNF